MMPAPLEKALTAEDIAMLDRIAPRSTRLFDQLDQPMVDPEARTITLCCFEGFLGMLLAALAIPALWLVLAIIHMVAS